MLAFANIQNQTSKATNLIVQVIMKPIYKAIKENRKERQESRKNNTGQNLTNMIAVEQSHSRWHQYSWTGITYMI